MIHLHSELDKSSPFPLPVLYHSLRALLIFSPTYDNFRCTDRSIKPSKFHNQWDNSQHADVYSENLFGRHRTSYLKDQILYTVGDSRFKCLTLRHKQMYIKKDRRTDGRTDGLVTTSGLSFLLPTIMLKMLKVWRHYHQGSQLIENPSNRKINFNDILTLPARFF